jgi:hypothetical protein
MLQKGCFRMITDLLKVPLTQLLLEHKMKPTFGVKPMLPRVLYARLPSYWSYFGYLNLRAVSGEDNMKSAGTV